ncbi:YciI family protein [Bacillus sp. P14.5]|uniref:YciI family protein n=1 Tax=Bacillus sp. P14.5 TaxID=1983400 RepID=UPI000DE8409A|nr:YciI family protein [Bacillus sp. P14.5]
MEKQQFVYKLRLVDKWTVDENWTDKENETVARHFRYLSRLLDEKALVMAGKTKGLEPSTFGIVIFEAETEEEAQSIMNQDPAVKEGIMTAELFPFQVALMQDLRQ